MSASLAIRSALMIALAAEPALAGVGLFDAPPPDPSPPFLTYGPDIVSDWSWKGGEGRAHRLTLTLWHADDGPELRKLMAAVEHVVLGLPAALPGARIVSARPERALVRRAPAGWTQGVAEFRILSVEDDDAS